MRSFRLLAATTVILFGAGACGDDNGGNGTSEDPVAGFTVGACTVGVPCTFTDASSDPQGAATITTRSWDFNGDNIEDLGGNVVAPSFTYTAAGTFQAKLTVTDNTGKTDDATVAVTVTGGAANVPPTASFDLPVTCVAGTPCGFHSTSTDPDGDITLATFAWDFGDTGVGTGADATHTYDDPGTYTVTLTVTDQLGAVSTPATQTLTVTAPTSTDCTTTGTQVNCDLTMNTGGTLTFTLVSRSCELSGNTLRMTLPFAQTILFNLCNQAPGATYTIQAAGGGANHVFTAGDVVRVNFVQGTPDPGDPATGDPGIQIDGGAPSWTLNIDDGGAAAAAGEPDFNDAVVSVQLNP